MHLRDTTPHLFHTNNKTCTKSKIQLSFVEMVPSVVRKVNMQSGPGVCYNEMHNSICSLLQGLFFGSNINTTGKGLCWVNHLCTMSQGLTEVMLFVCVFHHPSLHFPGLSDKRTWLCSRGRTVPWYCPVWHWILSLAQCFWWVRQKLCQKAPEEAHLEKFQRRN